MMITESDFFFKISTVLYLIHDSYNTKPIKFVGGNVFDTLDHNAIDMKGRI